MRKIVMLLVVIFSFVIFSDEVSAEICDSADIKRLEKLADMIDVSYEYIDNEVDSNTEDDYAIIDSYRIFVSNLNQELYIKKGLYEYRYSDAVEGTLMFTSNSGQMQMLVYTDRCPGKVLKTITLDLPKFNVYSYRRECKELEDLNLDFCDEWYQGYLDDRIFNEFIEPYINQDEVEVTIIDKIIQFFKQYYIYMIVGTVVIVGIYLLIVNYRKRSVLE